MHRAFVGDFQKSRALFGRQIALERDDTIDMVDLAFFSFALGAVAGVDFLMPEADLRPF